MAGDWIKIEHALPDKPEVIRMADALGIDPDAVTGKLVRFWSWCNIQTVPGNALGVTKSFVDRLTHQPGFSDALIKVDWLLARSGSLEVPHFDRHNGQTAKARAESNRRVAKHRERCNANVTENALQKPLPEKRREEVKIEIDTSRGRRPTIDQAKAAAANLGISPEKAEEWWHCREASEWMKGMSGGGISQVGQNWQSDLKTYASRAPSPNGTNGTKRKSIQENLQLP